MPGLTKIYPTLYIGDLSDANNSNHLYSIGITHIVSVGAEVDEKEEDISYLSLAVLDMEDQNIMKHFEPAFKFIDRARNGGACLVHCNAGISRSATICIAYIMKKFKLTVQDATETVSDVRPSICPNPGFVRQLEQYYLNLHPELKQKPSATIVATPSAAEPPLAAPSSETKETAIIAVESAPIEELPTPQAVTEEKMVEVTEEKVVYGCRTCRKPLFTMDAIMPHQVSQHDIAYHKRDKGNATSADRVICSSHYLQEPLKWMGNVDENEGKIVCPKCNSRIGFWKWDGQQCSCGTWITPAIQVAKNRVDERVMPITSLVPAFEQSS